MKVSVQAVNFNVDKKLLDFTNEKLSKLENLKRLLIVNAKEEVYELNIEYMYDLKVETLALTSFSPVEIDIEKLKKITNDFFSEYWKKRFGAIPEWSDKVWEFDGSVAQQYKQIGNAVPPLMANALAKKMKELLNE